MASDPICTCLSMAEVSRALATGGLQSRDPCPVHPDLVLPSGTFMPRIELQSASFDDGRQCPVCGGAGEVTYSTTPSIDHRDPRHETRTDPCGECDGTGDVREFDHEREIARLHEEIVVLTEECRNRAAWREQYATERDEVRGKLAAVTAERDAHRSELDRAWRVAGEQEDRADEAEAERNALRAELDAERETATFTTDSRDHWRRQAAAIADIATLLEAIEDQALCDVLAVLHAERRNGSPSAPPLIAAVDHLRDTAKTIRKRNGG